VTVVILLMIDLVLESTKRGIMKGKPMAVEYVMLFVDTSAIFTDIAMLKAMIRI